MSEAPFGRVEDRSAVDRVLAGETQAFEELVRRHEANVRSLCLSLLHNTVEADEAAQEVFWKAFRGLSGFRGEAAFSTWLHQISTRHCLDLLRARRRRPESLDLLLETHELAGPADRRDGEFDLPSALAALPPDYQMILALRESQGMTYEEIAQATATSLDAVKAKLRRARQALKERARHFFQAADVQKSESR